jgi:hypothetical protein
MPRVRPDPSLKLRHLSKVAFVLASTLASPSALAASCEELQQTIEARIRANGVASFTLTPVDAAASAPGQVVGTCDQGRTKLLYVRGAAAAAPAKQGPAASGVITECADGRVLKEGTCKK